MPISAAIALINGSVKSKKVRVKAPIKLTVDYAKTVNQAVADGKYNAANNDISSENFPVPGELIGKKVKISGKIFHFNRGISSEDVIKEMDEAEFRPATLMELLAFGAAYPELQKQYSIIALGSFWIDYDRRRYVPYLGKDSVDRRLDLDQFGNDWRAWYRFFGVRK
ncbi:MAG: hypothetical protein WC564_02605 [Patescibacteria group bacterium]